VACRYSTLEPAAATSIGRTRIFWKLLGSVFITMGDPIWFHLHWDYARAILLYEIVSWILQDSVVAKLAPPRKTMASAV
jgi:hypothetical protein